VLSVASVWEMQIKLNLGKLKLTLPLSQVIDSQRQTNGIEILPIKLEHVLALEKLSLHHKDPFDRMLIAQALVEDVVVISGDPVFGKYSVNIMW